MTPTIDDVIRRITEDLNEQIKSVVIQEKTIKVIIYKYLKALQLPPSQHLKDEQFVEQFEKYCEEELKQSTPKIEPHIQKIQWMWPYNEMTVVESKINELIDDNMRLWDYINNKD